jgi:hypothetical protein
MENKTYYLYKSSLADKKYSVRLLHGTKVINFGAKGYEDYTKHNDKERRELYLKRHEKKEDWSKDGIESAGFWARWILWNKKTLKESIKDTEDRFNIDILFNKK